jgi:hypothetical protein
METPAAMMTRSITNAAPANRMGSRVRTSAATSIGTGVAVGVGVIVGVQVGEGVAVGGAVGVGLAVAVGGAVVGVGEGRAVLVGRVTPASGAAAGGAMPALASPLVRAGAAASIAWRIKPAVSVTTPVAGSGTATVIAAVVAMGGGGAVAVAVSVDGGVLLAVTEGSAV